MMAKKSSGNNLSIAIIGGADGGVLKEVQQINLRRTTVPEGGF